MRILSLTYEYPPLGGGGGAVAAALNRELVRLGHQVEVVTSAAGGLLPTEEVDGAQVHRAMCWRRHHHYATAGELATTLWPAYQLGSSVIRSLRPHVIHTHFALPSGVVAHALAARFGIPYVITTHGSDVPGYNPDRFAFLHKLMAPGWSRVLGGAAAVTSPSAYLAGLIHARMDVPVEVVPNGYEATGVRARTKSKIILAAARLFPRKGIRSLVEASVAVPRDWRIIVAGDGPQREELKSLACHMGSRVEFTGFLDRATLRDLYAQAAIFAFPSVRENFPMVLLEALDAGCAIITTDAEGCAEVVGAAGQIVPRADTPALCRALLAMIKDTPQRIRLGELARERSGHFHWSRIAHEYLRVFKTAIDRHWYPEPQISRRDAPELPPSAPVSSPQPASTG